MINQDFLRTAAALQLIGVEAHHHVKLLVEPEVNEAAGTSRGTSQVQGSGPPNHPTGPAQKVRGITRGPLKEVNSLKSTALFNPIGYQDRLVGDLIS